MARVSKAIRWSAHNLYVRPRVPQSIRASEIVEAPPTVSPTRVTIDLPSRYPLTAPTAAIRTPILHPNVYSSGQICLGVTWIPTFGLDFLVKRIIQIITFDPAILNEKSPANGEALSWYRDAVRRHAHAFPTDTTLLTTAAPDKKLKWTNIESKLVKVVVACSQCGGKISLPAGKSGQVKCPRCERSFEART
jgi:hypothetical protein